MSESSRKSLSHEARELVGIINGLAAEIMYDQYKNLTIQMKIRLANLIKNTQRMLDDDQV